MYKPMLSIIIPTKNRQQYAIHAVKSILKNKNTNFEIVIQDNSDSDTLKPEIDGINDTRVVYKYTSECLSFCNNFEAGVQASSGDYIIIIGDDDGISARIFDLVEIVRTKGIEAVNYSKNISYYWPNAVEGSSKNAELVIRDVIPYATAINCSDEALHMLEKGDYDYQNYRFPRVYHGIVKREVFDLVYETTGHYFGGLTPDIYSSVALSFYVKRMLYVNFPFSFYGICATSGSADSITGRHRGELKDAPHFRGTKNYKWDEEIPDVYSVDTIWAESAYKAIKENKKESLLPHASKENYMVYLCKRNPQFIERFMQFYRARNECKHISMIALKCRIKTITFSSIITKGFIFVGRLIVGRHVFKNVDSIYDATRIVEEFYSNMKKYTKAIAKLDDSLV